VASIHFTVAFRTAAIQFRNALQIDPPIMAKPTTSVARALPYQKQWSPAFSNSAASWSCNRTNYAGHADWQSAVACSIELGRRACQLLLETQPKDRLDHIVQATAA